MARQGLAVETVTDCSLTIIQQHNADRLRRKKHKPLTTAQQVIVAYIWENFSGHQNDINITQNPNNLIIENTITTSQVRHFFCLFTQKEAY